MREIKFRAWDKVNKKYVYDVGVRNGKLLPNAEIYGSSWEINTTALEFSWKIEDLFEPVEQFTGLKDKNGREIYEGDILNRKNTLRPDIINETFRVNFWGGMFCSGTIYPIFDIAHKSIVIGNIHENQELLMEEP